MQIGGQL